ncbi:MAG: UDP-N-acetylmuramoyl-tripeptide--D-alanyl-D-alanine ligase [Synergistaceae bacterium]|jgi:UDP-N-acetylmuramoyl-tripeptide--D-alanyl-D-alanine ligase|nr:UDP-N-acetylmuramoyl-tripeptide--D-alanyl-D-alanine ligase [Synergistaceae bacterium]
MNSAGYGEFLSLFFLCAHGVSALHWLHMFQLNSYKTGVQLRWLVKNKKDYLGGNWGVLCVFPALLLDPIIGPSPISFLLFPLLFAWQFWRNRPRRSHKIKKPLVYTNRVKRMLTTYAILALGTAFLALRAGSLGVQAAELAVAHLLAPGFILLANGINSPLEKAINRWYLEDARRRLREHPGLTVLGVTGSYGKTSVKFFLRKLLSFKYDVLATPENFNTTLGVVRTLREELKPFHEFFVCEMGAKNVGDIKEICDLVEPAHGVITAIGPQHLESFKTLENVVRTKFELADSLPEEGVVFLNLDDERIRAELPRLGESGRKTVTYGFSQGSDYRARDVKVSEEGSSFSVVLPGSAEIAVETGLIGAHNVIDALAAIAVADFLGVPRKDIAAGVSRLEGVPHRLQLIRRGEDVIIDDAYNANAAGAKAALDVLALFEGCKILVTPGMVELGPRQDELNEIFGTQAAEVCDFVILVGQRQTESVRRGLLDARYPESRFFVVPDLGEGLSRLASIDTGGRRKVVLLENDLPDNY